MLYIGNFRTLNDDLIEVKITTNNNTDSSTEIIFAGESPVIIAQTSQDGIFTPIKSRSCTITIVSKEEYFDMYSGTSHGTKVEVTNITRDNDCLFFGYLTPCQYNQPFNYLNEIELEAVDALSSLKDFRYTYVNGNNSSLVLIKDVVKRFINDIAGYNGNIYLPDERLKMASERNMGFTMYESVSEEAFMDDDEGRECYEILEDICNFHNLSAVPIGKNVWFLDYELISKVGTTNNSDLNNLRYYNLNTSGYIMIDDSSVNIVKENYAGDENNLEMDTVYNKVSIECDTIEIDEDDLVIDPIDEASSATFWNAITSDMQRSDGELWKSITRIFEYIHGSYLPSYDSSTRWQTLSNINSQFQMYGYKLTGNFTNRQISLAGAWMEFPYQNGYIFNHIVGQTALITQQFNYQASQKVPSTASWTPFVMFFPQAEWIDRWLHDQYDSDDPIYYYSDMHGNRDYWINTFYNEHMGAQYPVLAYRGKKDIAFSPTDTNITNYLMFQGDLLWQQNCTYDDVNYHLWQVDANNRYYGGTLFQIKDCGAHDTHTCWGCERGSGDADFNKGWPMLKMRIKIGNKYWNGSYWTTTDSTFWVNYHKENVQAGDEVLIWSDYNKPVSNLDYTYGIRKDGLAIPITKSDALYGRIAIDIWMPRIPYTPGVIYGDEVVYQAPYMRLNFEKTPPVIFMKDMAFSLESASNDRQHWYLDFSDVDEEDDDIIYSNEINSNNVEEFDDLTLKINTYNDKVKVSQSYIIENNVYHNAGYYRPYTNTTQRQEMNVVDRYVEHYSTPKKIYNATIHGYLSPWKLVKANALEDVRMIVDEQEFDVKADRNTVKLVQY